MGKGKGKHRPWYEVIKRSSQKRIDDVHRKISPHTYVEKELIRIAKMNEDQRFFYKEYQQFLADEREKRIDEIKSSITVQKKVDGTFNFSRIVSSKYSHDPFNGSGSVIRPPGGRFNFGRSVSYSKYFIGIYFANSFETAFAEKFQANDIENEADKLLDFSLAEPGSFSYVRAKIELESYLDLTSKKSLEDFCEVIKDIVVPDYIKKNGRKVGMSTNLISDVDSLVNALLDPAYTQSGTWLDQPSPSQWFGHYVRLAGLQGILYPSVRYSDGQNLVIFPDNFEDSSSSIVLSDDFSTIPPENSFVNKSNHRKFINLS